MLQNKLSMVIPFIFLLFICSCKKENLNGSGCHKGCVPVRLSGKLFDLSSSEPIPNIEIKARFYEWKSTCYFCFGEPLETSAKTVTDNNGNFSFSILVDTSVFKESYHYEINVSAKTNDTYINGKPVYFTNYKQNFSNILVAKYKKTELQILYQRDSSERFSTYVADYTFYDPDNRVTNKYFEEYFIKVYSPLIQDTVVKIETGANFFTKILGRKHYDTLPTLIRYDSVFCKANVVNNITIKY